MTNRSAAEASAISQSFEDADKQTATQQQVRTAKVRRRLSSRNEVQAAADAASQYGSPVEGVTEGGTWDQSVLDAQHEQLNASASDHYHATLDRLHSLKSTWSNMVATVWIFGDTSETPNKFNWTKLIDMAPYRNDGGGDPAYTNPDLLGYETREEANEWREQASDLFLTITDACWEYIKRESDQDRGIKVAPLADDGSFGPYTEVALLFEFAECQCQAFATMDDDYPGGWSITRIDIGDVQDADGNIVWDDEEDLILINRYATIKKQLNKADRLQRQSAAESRRRKQADAMTARSKRRGGLVK
tara:strand:+ start:1189 stop:2100 length:912 start_codon:yes stop_codon:yes gene_type:complete